MRWGSEKLLFLFRSGSGDTRGKYIMNLQLATKWNEYINDTKKGSKFNERQRACDHTVHVFTTRFLP